jgi:dienelactone hydrolase
MRVPGRPLLALPLALVVGLGLACGDSTVGSATDDASSTAADASSTSATSSDATTSTTATSAGSTGDASTGGSTGAPTTSTTSTTSATTDASDSATTSTSTTQSSDATTTTDGLEITDFGMPGPFAVDTSDGSTEVGEGCDMTYTLYTPAGVDGGPLAVVAHGFTQSKGNMAQIAARIASHGVRTVAVDLCHASIIDTDHPQNGVDLTLLAEALAPGGDVIYVGYSAGGLATFIAAASDDDTRALLGLDPVDADGLGAAAAPGVDAPTLALHGEPGSCNNNGDSFGLATLVPGGWALSTIGGSHCDFQQDEGFACGLCGPNHPDVRALIVSLSAAFVAWQAGVDPSGEAWVTIGGERYLELVGEGALGPL